MPETAQTRKGWVAIAYPCGKTDYSILEDTVFLTEEQAWGAVMRAREKNPYLYTIVRPLHVEERQDGG